MQIENKKERKKEGKKMDVQHCLSFRRLAQRYDETSLNQVETRFSTEKDPSLV